MKYYNRKFTIIISHSIEEQKNKKSHTLHPVCNLTETKTSTIQRNSFTKAIIKQTKTLLNKTDGNLCFCFFLFAKNHSLVQVIFIHCFKLIDFFL